MNKIVFADNQEFDIREGASTVAIVAVVKDFTALGTLADALAKPGNLDNVLFKTGETVTGEYTVMKLESPLFKAVDIVGARYKLHLLSVKKQKWSWQSKNSVPVKKYKMEQSEI